MTEPTKTAENPRLELAIADAMRENIESTRIMDHVEPLKKVVEGYAAQQVAAERKRIKKEMAELMELANFGYSVLSVNHPRVLEYKAILERAKELIDSL